MTSRTPIGGPPRPPQRAMSNSSLSVQVSQRPSHNQRSFSQQQQQPPSQTSSPVRNRADSSSFIDLADSSADTTPGRNGMTPTPKRVGSRLRLEMLQQDMAAGGPGSMLVESPSSLTPGARTLTTTASDMEGISPAATSRASAQDGDSRKMPMPKRLARPVAYVKSRRDPRTVAAASVKKDTRPKPYTIETPQTAPKVASTNKDAKARSEAVQRDPFSMGLFSGHADFFPWSGHHHEDGWSTDAIQKGTWDKASQTESSSARVSIFPTLKSKGGLTALTTIFMGVLGQRRTRGTITAPSTFKPPPRVTLTDTKREVWLRDLANPAISLRKLSRTIPHGIRGRTLLDQCLNKSVPTERAVWLAKCVGANEIRAFKRKGVNAAFAMGGESKWIRDWTVFVEQFVESVTTNPGEESWKDKVNYALRLATHLFSEQLLDRDHYLDWILASLENTAQSKLPIWILIAKIYWKDLLRSRKTGRRLVTALLSHLHTIQQDPDRDLLMPLYRSLSSMIRGLVQNNPESFLSPNTWPQCEETLQGCVGPDVDLSSLRLRNTRLQVDSSSTPNGTQRLVRILDSALQGPVEKGFADKCWSSSDDKKALIKTVVNWATSVHRPGIAKVYIAVRLARSFSKYRVDPTRAILDVLENMGPEDETRKQNIYHLVMELTRTQHFSMPQYYQWLIARGGFHSPDEIDAQTGSCGSRLLVEIPAHSLRERSVKERASLLRRAGYSVLEEQQDMENAWRVVRHCLGLPLPDDDVLVGKKAPSLKKVLGRIGQSSRGLRSYVCSELHQSLRALSSKGDFALSVQMFVSVRSIFEHVQDFSLLADVLTYCTKASNPEVLASCADTVNANMPVLQALGVEDDLFRGLLDRLRQSQSEGTVVRSLLAAVTALAQRLPGETGVAKQLSEELAQNDRSNAIDACSPVSDNMIGSQSQGPTGELSEEIDKLLAGGTSIDRQTMVRLVSKIIPKIEAGWQKSDDSLRVYASLLARLRIFDTQQFDKIIADWVSHIRALTMRPPLSQLYPLLLSVGCLTMSTLFNTANTSTANTDDADDTATYLRELLGLALVELRNDTGLTPEEIYRFQTHQQIAVSNSANGLLTLIRNAAIESTHDGKVLSGPVRVASLNTLRSLVVRDSAAVAEALSIKTVPASATGAFRRLAAQLLVPDMADTTSSATFDQILGLANELTMPFCQLELNVELAMSQQAAAGDDARPSQFDLFAKAMDSAIEARNILWTSMLPCLSDDIAQHLRTQAHGRFLDLIPSVKSTALEDEATNETRIQLAKNLLSVMEAIASGKLPPRSTLLSPVLAEKTQDLWGIVSSTDVDVVKVQPAVLTTWLPLLLRFIVIQSAPTTATEPAVPLPVSTPTTATMVPKPAGTLHHSRAGIIVTLCAIFTQLSDAAASQHDLVQQIFDVAIFLTDQLPDDLRQQCAKLLLPVPGIKPTGQVTSDPRLYYLFSVPHPTRMDSLMLSYRDKLFPTPPSSGQPSAAGPPSGLAGFSTLTTARGMHAMYGIGPPLQERLAGFAARRWEMLSEPTPNVGENDTSLNLGLFEAIKIT